MSLRHRPSFPVPRWEPGSDEDAAFVDAVGRLRAAAAGNDPALSPTAAVPALGSMRWPGGAELLGSLLRDEAAYDKKVAGVVSGAGELRPALVLDRRPERQSRAPLALMGKTYCKVDASFGAIALGDLLTTSPTAGHAIKANDPHRAFGAVIGKALRPLAEGHGLIPVLAARQ